VMSKKIRPTPQPRGRRRAEMGAIGRDLQATYADIVAEGVPERFADPAPVGRTERRRFDSRALDREGRRRPMSAYTVSFGG
jgi:hypothetical protein